MLTTCWSSSDVNFVNTFSWSTEANDFLKLKRNVWITVPLVS